MRDFSERRILRGRARHFNVPRDWHTMFVEVWAEDTMVQLVTEPHRKSGTSQPLGRVLDWYLRFQIDRAWLLSVLLSLSMLGAVVLASRLELHTEFSALLREQSPSVREYHRLAKQLPSASNYMALLGSKNQAVHSLGLLAVFGEICCLLAAVLVIPAVIEFQNRLSRNNHSAAMKSPRELAPQASGATNANSVGPGVLDDPC